MKPSKTLFINQKGGVGKTTLLREAGFYLASLCKKVLFVDCDPQGNLTKSLVQEPGKGLYEALEDDEVVITKVRENLSLVQADKKLTALAKRMVSDFNPYNRVSTLLEREEFQDFDYILLDTPPGLGIFTINGLAATDNIIIPMPPQMYSMHGANDVVETINKARKQLNDNLNILGVIINGYDSRPIIINQIKDEIKRSFGGIVFDTFLSRSVKIEEVIASRIGLIELDDDHKIKDEAIEIGAELLRRLEAFHG